MGRPAREFEPRFPCGHLRTERNTIIRRAPDSFSESCRTCRNEKQRKRYYRIKANYDKVRGLA